MQDECKLIIKDLKKQIKVLKKDDDKNYQRLTKLFNIAVKQNNGGFSSLGWNKNDIIEVKPKKPKKKKKK